MTDASFHIDPNVNFSVSLFEKTVRDFADNLLEELENLGLLANCTQIDHICYRVGTLESYELWKDTLATISDQFSEAFVNGRPIACFKLKSPVQVRRLGEISVLELPAPKPGRHYSDGFEHIEVVTDWSLEQILEANTSIAFEKQNLNSPVNADVSVQLKSGLVKFHKESLEKVIDQEKHEKASHRHRLLAIFDFDETLAVSKSAFQGAMRLALQETLCRQIGKDEMEQKVRPTFPELFAQFELVSELQVRQSLEAFSKYWREFEHDIFLPQGMRTALSCLADEGFDIVVWTARDKETTVSSLKHLDVLKYVTDVYGFAAGNTSKPIPPPSLADRVQYAQRNNGRVFLCGDSLSDKQGAENLAVPFLLATWSNPQTTHQYAGFKDGIVSPLELLHTVLGKNPNGTLSV